MAGLHLRSAAPLRFAPLFPIAVVVVFCSAEQKKGTKIKDGSIRYHEEFHLPLFISFGRVFYMLEKVYSEQNPRLGHFTYVFKQLIQYIIAARWFIVAGIRE